MKSGILIKRDESNNKLVRYFILGTVDEEYNCINGVAYDYIGGGSFQKFFIVDGKIDTSMEAEVNLDIHLEAITKNKFSVLENLYEILEVFISYSYLNKKYTFNEEYTNMCDNNLIRINKINPINLGNTVWAVD